MLVYHVDPMGYTTVNGRRVYGKFFNYGRFGPTEMTYETFKKSRAILQEANITHEWLTKRFNVSFPAVSFKITEMWKLDFGRLIEVATLLGIKYKKSRYPTATEKRALRKAVIKTIDGSFVLA